MPLYRGIALTIAGSDSGGGAGIQADLKTFAALKVFGTSAITALTSQNSLGVQDVFDIPAAVVAKQIESVLSDFPVMAAKTGMLSRADTIETVASSLERFHLDALVVDPVMVAQSGDSLIAGDAVEALIEHLLPRALLVTPNVPEAERLSGLSIEGPDDMVEAARAIASLGPKAVLVKGGHLDGEVMTDILFFQDRVTRFQSPRQDTNNTHGTGCTLSSAIAAELATGRTLTKAVELGREYLQAAMRFSFQPGHGYGPLGHAVTPDWVEEVRP